MESTVTSVVYLYIIGLLNNQCYNKYHMACSRNPRCVSLSLHSVLQFVANSVIFLLKTGKSVQISRSYSTNSLVSIVEHGV